MVTGDNLLIAISVSKECGIVQQSGPVYFGRVTEPGMVVWDCNEPALELDSFTLKPIIPNIEEETTRLSIGTRGPFHSMQSMSPKFVPLTVSNCSSLVTQHNIPASHLSNSTSISKSNDVHIKNESSLQDKPLFNRNYSLAVAGDVFDWMLKCGNKDTFYRMLVKAQIFARFSPDQKHVLVEKLQEIGYCVSFCGDGANDCGALKAADVGVSLSESDASVAAPFTSRNTDLDCVPLLIREGRAALVTSFACFKYIALYSLIQFTSVTLLYSILSNLGDFQFLYIDLFLILPLAVSSKRFSLFLFLFFFHFVVLSFIFLTFPPHFTHSLFVFVVGRSLPYPVLHVKRPPASLVSKKMLSSLIGLIIIQIIFQMIIFYWVQNQSFYTPFEADPNVKDVSCYENTVVFLLSCFQYILVAVVISVGPPYREKMIKNCKFFFILLYLAIFLFALSLFF